MIKYLVAWIATVVVQTAPVADPYTGLTSQKPTEQTAQQLFVRMFNKPAEADKFIADAPAKLKPAMKVLPLEDGTVEPVAEKPTKKSKEKK